MEKNLNKLSPQREQEILRSLYLEYFAKIQKRNEELEKEFQKVKNSLHHVLKTHFTTCCGSAIVRTCKYCYRKSCDKCQNLNLFFECKTDHGFHLVCKCAIEHDDYRYCKNCRCVFCSDCDNINENGLCENCETY